MDSSFQRDHEGLSRGQLYERLLDRFAEREVTKTEVDRTEADLAEDVRHELDRLSVVALAMFNRGVQWVAEHEVTADLSELLGIGSPERLRGTRTPLSAGETVLGRFFFMQRTEAVREDRAKLRTYEFLHATFGEYLVARFVWHRLLELRREDEARSRRKSTVDDTELYSVLSFAALTASTPVLDFLREFAERSDRDGLFDLVSRLFAARDESRGSRGGYAPVSLPDSARDAKYSLNLVVLAVVLRGRCYSDDLALSVDDWRRLTLFWKSRLPASEWASVVLWLWVERDAERHFSVCLNARIREAHTEWLVMSEPYVTLDEVALTFRDMVTPLTSRHSLDVTAALIELTATPPGKSVSALRRLKVADAGGRVFTSALLERLGRGGDDLALLEISRPLYRPGRVELVEAFMRMYDRSDRFADKRDFLRLVKEAVRFEGTYLEATQPGLLTRARQAAVDLGLEWPPSEPGPGPRDRAR